MVTLAEEKLNETLLRVFDRLFDRAVVKLNLECTDDDRKEARENFASRFRDVLEAIDNEGSGRVSADELEELVSAIDDLKPAHIAGYLAVGPLAIHMHKVMRSIAVKAAEQRLIETLISQADDRYGGN